MFTYDPTLADNISRVRFFLRDTIEQGAYFADEELLFLLTEAKNNVYQATAEAAFALWTEFTSLSTVAEVDDIRIESRDKAKWFKQVYDEFKERAMREKSPPIIISGGDRTTFWNNSEGRGRESRTTAQINNFFDCEV